MKDSAQHEIGSVPWRLANCAETGNCTSNRASNAELAKIVKACSKQDRCLAEHEHRLLQAVAMGGQPAQIQTP